MTFSDNREELVCKRRHYLDGGDKLSSPEEKGKGKRKKLKNGRYSDDDDDDVVSLVGNYSFITEMSSISLVDEFN